MSDWNQNIFEDLISDNDFIAWVRGEEISKKTNWENWKNDHPLYNREFSEAILMVKKLNFRGTVISQNEIQYSWAKTSEKIGQGGSVTGIRRFMALATKVAAILLLPTLLVSVWMFYSQHTTGKKYANLLENKSEQRITVTAPIGARIEVDLPDGSKAWLNSGSEIIYPVVFNSSERRIKLTGEAFFKVQKSETPFYVSNLGPAIKVYGTEFNVNSYADEDFVTVALAEGKISLDVNGREEFLTPGQVSLFDKKRCTITIENTDVNTYSSWREGKYIFRDATLSAILRILQRQHNVNIQLLDPSLGNYRYNATINNESLEQILQMLSLSAPIKYNYTHRVMNADGTWESDNIEISADKTRIIKPKI
ncbi:MAG: FecR domain-containing protein [Prolixibacteraceae bacterium]